MRGYVGKIKGENVDNVDKYLVPFCLKVKKKKKISTYKTGVINCFICE